MDKSRHLVETQPHPAAAELENKTQESEKERKSRGEETGRMENAEKL